LRRNCLLKHVIEGKLEGRIEMTGRWRRRRKQLLDDVKEKRRYWKLKEEALDRTMWRTRFGRGYGPVVRQTTEWMNTINIFVFPMEAHGFVWGLLGVSDILWRLEIKFSPRNCKCGPSDFKLCFLVKRGREYPKLRPLGQLISQARLPTPTTKHYASSASQMWAVQRLSSFVTVILSQPRTQQAGCVFVLPTDMCYEEKVWNVFLRLILRHSYSNKMQR
jgi:hypothetical protein